MHSPTRLCSLCILIIAAFLTMYGTHEFEELGTPPHPGLVLQPFGCLE